MLPEDARIISVDDHLVEPPHLWQDRLPARYAEAGPHVVALDEGDVWIYEGRKYTQGLLSAVAGRDPSEWNRNPIRFGEIRRGCFDPKARLEDMDVDGVYAQMQFPNWPRLAGTLFYTDGEDRELAALCIKAWNDFILDEWCATDPDRLIPLVLVPFWDPEAAAAEIRRTAALGAKSVSFLENPSPLDLPSFHTDHWDPFFDAVQECDMPISLHFGSSGQTPYVSPDAPYAVTSALIGQNAMGALTDLVFSPVLQRFPQLKFVLSESGIGWIPYMVERLDQMWHEHRHYQQINFDARPSDIVRDHFWSCTITEPFGLAVRDHVGVGNILLESDYPHGDGSWPNTRKRAAELLADVPDDEARRIAERNAVELFHLEGV